MSGFQLLLKGMQNGGTQLSTMSLPWLELVFLVSPMHCQNLDGNLASFKLNLRCIFTYLFKKPVKVFELLLIGVFQDKKVLHALQILSIFYFQILEVKTK